VVCHLSYRNSAAAVAHLLQKMNIDHVLVSSEHGIQSVLRSALAMTDGAHKSWENYVSDMPAHEDIFNDEAVELLPKIDFDLNTIAFYIHSSGTNI
jgi:hypothetical protein